MSPSPFVAAGVLPWDDVPYEEQLTRRHARVEEAFRRGRVVAQIAPVVPSPRQSGYRARVKLRGDGTRLGFYREGSHALVEGPLERIVRPEILSELGRIRGLNGEIELRTNGVDVRADRAFGGFGAGPLVIDGLRVSAPSFFQVNLEVNRLIVAQVDAWIAELAPIGLLDLFGGVGNLTAAAARRGTPLILVEREGAATSDARHNLAGTQAQVVAGDALKVTAGQYFCDVVVLDPPRAGAPGVLKTLAVTRPRAVIYLSCDPTTGARDIATLLPLGYRVTDVIPYDMFPGTDHVETLVRIERQVSR